MRSCIFLRSMKFTLWSTVRSPRVDPTGLTCTSSLSLMIANIFLRRELLLQKGAFSEFLTQHIQDLDDDEDIIALQNAVEDNELKNILERSISTISGRVET